jgi:hypothetical protein
MECWAVYLTLTFGTSVDRRAVSYTLRPQLMPQEISWFSFQLEAEWTPGLLNVHSRNRLLENFQGPYRESNTEPPLGKIRTIL